MKICLKYFALSLLNTIVQSLSFSHSKEREIPYMQYTCLTIEILCSNCTSTPRVWGGQILKVQIPLNQATNKCSLKKGFYTTIATVNHIMTSMTCEVYIKGEGRHYIQVPSPDTEWGSRKENITYLLGINLISFVQDNTNLVIMTTQGGDNPFEFITDIQLMWVKK